MWRVVLVAGLVWAGGAGAAGPQRRPTSLATLSGTCSRFFAQGNDMTAACQTRIVSTEFSDGRVTWTYIVGDDFTFTFSGDGRGQVHRTVDTAVQPIDTTYSSLMGQASKPSKAVGSCEFANPYKGPAAVNCTAESDGGRVEARFTSDGRPPAMKQLR